MRSGNKARKSHQSYWSDLKPWVEQLYEDHRVYLEIRIHLFSERHDMRPTVAVTAYRVLSERRIHQVAYETAVLNTEDQGHAEALTLRIVSGMLLQLENEKAQAERQAGMLFA